MVVDTLEDSGCDELLDVLNGAAQGDDRAWAEVLDAVYERGNGLAALDLVVEIGQRATSRAWGS